MMPILRPFLWLTAIAAVVSGIGIGGSAVGDDGIRLGAVSFSVEATSATALELVKIILVMVGGILLSATTTPFAMKRGIERILSPLARIRFPVEAISLTGSLLLRFIPVLRREAGRFNRIAKSRGKRVRRSGMVRLRDLPVMIVPLLLSLLQMATDLSHALEARGYMLKGTRTAAVTLRMKRPDWLAVAAGGVLLALMLALSVRE
jgi:energy-coupling factor transport system ATP-binding protein